MKRLLIWIVALGFILGGCASAPPVELVTQAPQGTIGDDIPITRSQAAKMLALAFYTQEEIENLPQNASFPDVSKENWAYPYINAVVELNFFSGDGEGFRPEDDLLLWEAQILMDRVAPDYEKRMVLTEDNRNMPVAYSLWTQLFEKALMARRGEESLYSYGIKKQTQVLFTGGEDSIFDGGIFGADGYDLSIYTDEKISFWEKDGEMIGLLAVEETTPTVENIYCQKKGNQIMLTGVGQKAYTFEGGDFEAGLCNVTIDNGKATVKEGTKLSGEVVKRVDEKGIYLSSQGEMQWAEGFRVYGQDLLSKNYFDLICGTDLADYYIMDGKLMGAIIKKDVVPEKIRVLLGGGLQESISIKGAEGFSLSNGVGEKDFTSSEASLTADLAWFDYGIVTVSGKVTLTFDGGEARTYTGLIEMERIDDKIAIINELNMEEYLVGVVPNEMPVSFGQAALEAQAICARSYAYNQFYANAYGKYGAHVTDTVASQVFMGAQTALEAENAVMATKGMCVVAGDRVAQTYFYSTSCGFGTKDTDVWSADGTFSGSGKSYLQGQAYGVTQEMPKTEEEWLGFWQDWQIDGYDKASAWYRWKVYYSAGQLTEITEKTFGDISSSNQALIKVKQGDDSWKAEAPKGLGKLTGIKVAERGEGGVIKILEMSFEKGSVQVLTENAIRKVLSPTKLTIGDTINLQRISGGTLIGQKMLPSAFFAIKEMKNNEGTLTGVALYGGGCGHGVGLSQYGAKELAGQGLSGEEIVETYFPNTTVEKAM
ncbi:amidase enhancer precursor [Anaerotignum neopropionicum]|uniref:Amidase enhancer n=1 Tax=Anaerotignum neopropionicum TaxID=36847 RepID=A0A136WBI7_9FIRM|nr:SpoIID/LytB domain-containing protein [Anaerotignum neopropionicum]KXL51865.1 amidase enhancer precursor [Anaerotignum neopropionicum]